jgi:hypothetical protein
MSGDEKRTPRIRSNTQVSDEERHRQEGRTRVYETPGFCGVSCVAFREAESAEHDEKTARKMVNGDARHVLS